MPQIASRNVASVEYDQDEQKLEVTFRSGGVYNYFGVPEYVYGQMIQSIDPGGFFNTEIKERYQFERTE